ncbi:MAG: 4'-phosphopantetheinyl transferase superfamily protein [Rubrivivax sp.]|nr:4'-phosphopantetheinyl transferase superfamily protein [Rubrivivax sp.]
MADRPWFDWLSNPSDPHGPLRRLPSPLPGARLWLIDLDEPLYPRALDGVSEDEVQRALRLRFERDRQRFLTGRVWLRQLLAHDLGCEPRDLQLVSGAHGKPALQGPDPSLTFNMSHSGHRALVALSRDVPVGVDIELHRRMPDARALAHAHFDAEEVAAWSAQPSSERERAFFRLWTRKEACLKAWGMGLALEPARVHVGLLPQAAAVHPPAPDLGGPLTVASVPLADNAGYEAALSLGSASWRRDSAPENE